MFKRKKSQVWYIDFVIALVIFSIMFITYFIFLESVAQEKDILMLELLNDGKVISNQLMSAGHPTNWTNDSVLVPGLTNGNMRINETKLFRFFNMSYNQTREALRTQYHYYIILKNRNGTVMSINGMCGLGNPLIINESGNEIKLSYVYHDQSGTELLDNMQDLALSLNVTLDIFEWKNGDDSFKNFLANNMSAYDHVVFEHPKKAFSEKTAFEGNISEFNGTVFLSGELGSDGTILNVDHTGASCNAIDVKNVTVIKRDPLLDLSIGDILDPQNNCNYIEGASEVIAEYKRFKLGSPLPSKPAIVKWPYGNADVYYFTHFEAEYLGDENLYQQLVQDGIEQYVNDCTVRLKVDTSPTNNLVRINRFLIYKSQIINMGLYIWI
ncbi:hypothetical protein GOV04_03610 [Candidatus Woesearchaeota archaeon]|nr:hypothetical protein [Candidatus Woesearchaeota archaeon]